MDLRQRLQRCTGFENNVNTLRMNNIPSESSILEDEWEAVRGADTQADVRSSVSMSHKIKGCTQTHTHTKHSLPNSNPEMR